jgi:hypothetical protein
LISPFTGSPERDRLIQGFPALKRSGFICAPVAQGIEHRFPKPNLPILAYPAKREKTLENKAFPHFLALCRNVPKRAETRPSGSKYYRPILTSRSGLLTSTALLASALFRSRSRALALGFRSSQPCCLVTADYCDLFGHFFPVGPFSPASPPLPLRLHAPFLPWPKFGLAVSWRKRAINFH